MKLQENWNINKEEDGTETIIINTTKIPTKKVNQDEDNRVKTTTTIKEKEETNKEST